MENENLFVPIYEDDVKFVSTISEKIEEVTGEPILHST